MDNHLPPHLGAILLDHDRGPEYALMECIADSFSCPNTQRVEQSAQLTDGEITEILAERGWSVGPTLCPEHDREKETA